MTTNSNIKRTIKITAIALLVSLLQTSCKPKTERTIVQGYVKTFGSDVTHEGIEIELNERGAGQILLDKTVTNADGWYQLEGDFEENKMQYLYVVNTPPQHYYLSDEPNANFELNSGGVQRFDLEIPPVSWVNIHFKNINPCDQNDLISFFGNYSLLERINGAGVDLYYIWRTRGNQDVSFRYGTNKCGVGDNFLEKIGYVAAFDTVDFEVFY